MMSAFFTAGLDQEGLRYIKEEVEKKTDFA